MGRRPEDPFDEPLVVADPHDRGLEVVDAVPRRQDDSRGNQRPRAKGAITLDPHAARLVRPAAIDEWSLGSLLGGRGSNEGNRQKRSKDDVPREHFRKMRLRDDGVAQIMLKLAVVVCVGVLTVATPSAAQVDANATRASEAFRRGTTAAEELRWADALVDFQLAYRLSEVPTALLNAALVLRSLGRYVEARTALDQLARSHPDYEGQDEARQLRLEVTARIGFLVLEGVPARGRVFLDGAELSPPHHDTFVLDVDPGRRTMTVLCESFEPWTWSGHVASGARVVLEPTLRVVRGRRRALRVVLSVTAVLAIAAATVIGWRVWENR
ncbi:MAG: hypothetical protein MUE69_14605, partial [Myxococcota bacterium]|nr:hypothetical protein [Myxococcota bacterium]